MPRTLRSVYVRAYRDEKFLKGLVADPDAALHKAGVKLSAPDLARLKRALRRGVSIDLAGSIQMASRYGDEDPWPRLWP